MRAFAVVEHSGLMISLASVAKPDLWFDAPLSALKRVVRTPGRNQPPTPKTKQKPQKTPLKTPLLTNHPPPPKIIFDHQNDWPLVETIVRRRIPTRCD